jgi:D-amino-acid dehydrogenase
MKKVIIIGGGILGASTAYELIKLGADVTLIDREDAGQATKAAAGIICPWISQRRNKRWYLLAKEGARYYPTLIEELGTFGEYNTGYSKVGALSVHSESKKLEAMMARTLKRKEYAPEIGDVSILSPEEAKILFPPLAEDYGAVHISGAARVDGWALRNAIIRSGQKLGVKFLKSDCFLIQEGSKIIGVKTSDQTIFSDIVLITSGVWANELLEPLNVKLKVTAQKGQLIHLKLPNATCSNWPVIMPPHDQYILSLEDNRLVIGATHENDTKLDYRLTIGGIKEIIDKALLYAPSLANSTF